MNFSGLIDLQALHRELAPWLAGLDSAAELFQRWPTWPILHARGSALARGNFDVGELLWTDPALQLDPGENSARVLVTLHHLLERHRPLDGGEQVFLELYAAVVAAEPAHLTAAWSEPRCYYWTRRAYELVGALLANLPQTQSAFRYQQALGTGTPAATLTAHLQHIKQVGLGVAVRAGTDCRFATPYWPPLPFAVPGTHLTLLGPEPIAIEGLVAGQLQVSAGEQRQSVALHEAADLPAAISLRRCPIARHAGFELPLSPFAFHLPGLAVAEPVLRAGLDYQERHVALVEQALANIERYAPDLFAQFRRTLRVAALKPRDWGGFDDFSEPEVPGTFLASVVNNPLELADHLIHEFQHNRLSLIEESGPLFDTDRGDPLGDARYYSPWRDQLRALYGLYHGLYVFVAVSRYWLRVHGDDGLPATARPYVVDRLLRLPRQLALAVGVLRRHAQLTPLGRGLLEQLALEAHDLQAQVRRLQLPLDAPAYRVDWEGRYHCELSPVDGHCLTVRESLRDHLERNDLHGQCVGILEL